MRTIAIFSLSFLVVLSILISCDYVDVPQPTSGGVDTSINADTLVRKIFLEDYTGHLCGNCPGAAKVIHSLDSLYGEKIIAIGVHVGKTAGPNATPVPPNVAAGSPSGSFTSDFRTQTGDDYNDFFQLLNAGLPQGMINRTGYLTQEHKKDKSTWPTLVSTLLTNPPDVNIEISNSYTASSKALNVQIEAKFLKSLSGTYKVVALIVQDSITDWQTDYSKDPKYIQDYLHRHVLRDAINSSFGDTIASGTINTGDTFSKSYNYTIKDTYRNIVCNPLRCSVVVYIYDAASYEILQAEEKKIK